MFRTQLELRLVLATETEMQQVTPAELSLFPELIWPCFPSQHSPLSDGRQIRLNVAGLKHLARQTILTDLESAEKLLWRDFVYSIEVSQGEIVFHLQLMNWLDIANARHLGEKLCSILYVDLYCEPFAIKSRTEESLSI